MTTTDLQLFGFMLFIVLFTLFALAHYKYETMMLQWHGSHLLATVRYVHGRRLKADAFHPITQKRLFFEELIPFKAGQISYNRGDPIHVLVDLQHPYTYSIVWQTNPLQWNTTVALAERQRVCIEVVNSRRNKKIC